MKQKSWLSYLSLFTSMSTLICCALPALFVALGMGAAFAGLINAFPGLIWVSENKLWFFGLGGILLVIAGLAQWHARNQACPLDPELAAACAKTRKGSKIAYIISVGIYMIGAFFAFGGAYL